MGPTPRRVGVALMTSRRGYGHAGKAGNSGVRMGLGLVPCRKTPRPSDGVVLVVCLLLSELVTVHSVYAGV